VPVVTEQEFIVRFAEFELDLRSSELRTNGTSVRLQPQPARILAVLVRRRGETVTRDEIIKEVWGSDTFVDYEAGLNFAIRQIRSALGDNAERPLYVETVPKRGYRFVGSVVADPPPISRTRRYRRILWISVFSSAVSLVSLFALNIGAIREKLTHNDRAHQPASNPSLNIRRSVAVLGFKNLSQRQDAAWLSTALAEMLTTELGAGDTLRTISEENVARAKNDLSLADTDGFARDTLLRVRQNLGADLVLAGSYTDLGSTSGGQVRVDSRIQDAATGETIAWVSQVLARTTV
jgi:DNA-binding winged helix-turn-helix (wHTH) protein/TolB-like protein